MVTRQDQWKSPFPVSEEKLKDSSERHKVKAHRPQELSSCPSCLYGTESIHSRSPRPINMADSVCEVWPPVHTSCLHGMKCRWELTSIRTFLGSWRTREG